MISEIKSNENKFIKIGYYKTICLPSVDEGLKNYSKQEITIVAKIRYNEIQKLIYKNRIKDDRIRINDPLNFPYSAIGALFIKFKNNYWLGTGTLISPWHILTAAHNIFLKNEFEGSEIEFYPGLNNNEYIQYSTVKRVFLTNDFLLGQEKNDYALLVLEKPLGNLFGHFGVNVLASNGDISAKNVFHSFGYPGDKIDSTPGFYQMWGMEIKDLKLNNSSELEYTFDSYSGLSGSPIFYFEKDELNKINVYLVGIHTSSDSTQRKGYGVPINQERFDQLYEWTNLNKD